MEQKTCLECGQKLYGRSDKKFCDNHCRSGYHNRMSRLNRTSGFSKDTDILRSKVG